jgi:hypothetical protein
VPAEGGRVSMTPRRRPHDAGRYTCSKTPLE